MTSRPAAADAPLPMTVSSMVRPLAVVMVDMGISSWWRLWRSGKSVSALEPAVQGFESVLQRSGGLNVRERAGIGYKYLRARNTLSGKRGIAGDRPFGAAGSVTLSKHPLSILSWYEACWMSTVGRPIMGQS